MKIGEVPQSYIAMFAQWQEYISDGNKYLITSDFKAAKFQYEMARQYAEKIFNIEFDLYQAAPALVVTYHNIADLNRKLGDVSSVKFYLEKVHSTILKMLMQTAHDNEKHALLLRLSFKTYNKMIKFKKCSIYY